MMDMSEETRRSQEMFNGFVKGTIYSTIGVIVLLVLMAITLI